MRRQALTTDLVAELAGRTDDLGWLSIYVDASPERQSGGQTEWMTPVRTGLARTADRLKADGPRERWRAFETLTAELGDELTELLDPRTPGRGRGLFAALSGGEPLLVAEQVPFTDSVSVSASPMVQPLVVALDRHPPVGIVAIHRAGILAVDLTLGRVHEVAEASVSVDTTDWREMKGPAAANPSSPQQFAVQTDKFERRVEEHLTKALGDTVPVLRDVAARRGWHRLFLVGDPRLTSIVRSQLGFDDKGAQPDVVEVDKVSPEPDPEELARLVSEAAAALEAARQIRLVDDALAWAASGDRGITGRDDVLGAFVAGRVERLVVPEDLLDDELILAALDTSATISVVEGEAATRLHDHGGLAALARW